MGTPALGCPMESVSMGCPPGVPDPGLHNAGGVSWDAPKVWGAPKVRGAEWGARLPSAPSGTGSPRRTGSALPPQPCRAVPGPSGGSGQPPAPPPPPRSSPAPPPAGCARAGARSRGDPINRGGSERLGTARLGTMEIWSSPAAYDELNGNAERGGDADPIARELEEGEGSWGQGCAERGWGWCGSRSRSQSAVPGRFWGWGLPSSCWCPLCAALRLGPRLWGHAAFPHGVGSPPRPHLLPLGIPVFPRKGGQHPDSDEWRDGERSPSAVSPRG